MTTVFNGVGREIPLPERGLEPEAPPEEAVSREDALEYAMDFFDEFVAFAESYVPEIVDEFARKYPWQLRKWLREGVTVRMGGRAVC